MHEFDRDGPQRKDECTKAEGGPNAAAHRPWGLRPVTSPLGGLGLLIRKMGRILSALPEGGRED